LGDGARLCELQPLDGKRGFETPAASVGKAVLRVTDPRSGVGTSLVTLLCESQFQAALSTGWAFKQNAETLKAEN
jgi:hypothetical protein